MKRTGGARRREIPARAHLGVCAVQPVAASASLNRLRRPHASGPCPPGRLPGRRDRHAGRILADWAVRPAAAGDARGVYLGGAWLCVGGRETLAQYLVSEQLTRTSAELGLADHHCGRLGVGSVAPAQGLAWASEAVCLDFSEALPRYSSNNHCSCARPALTQAHVAKSWPWAWLQVLQNSRSQMFMLSVETPVSMRYPLALTKYKKKTLHRVQQYKSTCFSAQKATD